VSDLDPAICHRALRARDARFDGRFFVAVTSTGIYCRPICPAPTPQQKNCRFFPSAAAAQASGFRPCLRCRPEAAPETSAWRGTGGSVARALVLIAEGALDADGSVERLAERLGMGGRHLRRLFEQHLGASPIAVAQTRRVLFAKRLLHETDLPMSEVALASGFRSVRRFNETFRQLFRRPPSELRRKTRVALPEGSSAGAGVRLELAYRPPYAWDAVLAHFRARALGGVEAVRDGRYLRTLAIDGEIASLDVEHVPARSCLGVRVRCESLGILPRLIERVRRAFDLAADVTGIGAHLARDPWLAPLVAERPGLRVPGGWDGFEIAVRAILGQQISVAGARQLGERLVQLCGSRCELGHGLTHAFPSAEQLAAADVSSLGMPRTRHRALEALARASLADPRLFDPSGDVEASVRRLSAIAGVGEWTAQYIALRGLGEPDAFPSRDRGIERGIAARSGTELRPRQIAERAERWRPWRAYAAQHFWFIGV
jgi:AraC family transcriptional regulator of adaptative response / DNA-3-methyladenine glycosylase II